MHSYTRTSVVYQPRLKCECVMRLRAVLMGRKLSEFAFFLRVYFFVSLKVFFFLFPSSTIIYSYLFIQMKLIQFEMILSLFCFLLFFTTFYSVVAPTPTSSAAGQSSSNLDNLRLLANVAVPSNRERSNNRSGGAGGSRSGSRSRSELSSSVSQGSHHSTALDRNIVRGGRRSNSPSVVQEHVHNNQPSPSYKRQRSNSPPQGKQKSVRLFGKEIKEGGTTSSPPSSKSHSPKRQTSDSPTLRLFGKDISPSPEQQQQQHKLSPGEAVGGGGTSLFGIDLKKEAAKGKQVAQPSSSNVPLQPHGKSPVIHIESDSDSGKSSHSRHQHHMNRRSESSPKLQTEFPPYRRGDTPESQKTDASFSYSEHSDYGAKNSLSRRMPTQMKAMFSTKSQRSARSVRG